MKENKIKKLGKGRKENMGTNLKDGQVSRRKRQGKLIEKLEEVEEEKERKEQVKKKNRRARWRK